MKNITTKTRILLIILAVVIVPLFSGCSSSSQQSSYLVNLEIWGTFDDSLVYTEIVNQYKKINPYVGEIKYKKFSSDTYRQELLDALAAGQGPDIFMVGNGWLPTFANKIQPAPAPLVSDQDLKNNFPDVVTGDFMDSGKVYAVPLMIDSLQLYYNKDMFNTVGITAPPKTWQEFNDDVKKLTVIDSVGNIVQSGAAIGTAQNVNRATDIFSLLMFQNGVNMPTQKGQLAKFDEGVVDSSGSVVQAGEQALGYYTQFAKVSSAASQVNPLYVWNSRMHNSIDAFSEGSVAMMFNYSWQSAAIKSKNPKLNFAVASVPQVDPSKPVTIANYWGFAVSRNKLAPATSTTDQAQAVSNDVRTHEAWQFLRFLTLKNAGTITLYNAVTKNSKDFPINFDPAQDYLKRTQQPAARRDLIESQKTDAVLGPFAAGNLIAKHWYQVDSDASDKILSDAIDSVNRGDVSLHEALSIAKNRVNYLSGGSSAR